MLSANIEQHAKAGSKIDRSQIAILVPTCNAAAIWDSFANGIKLQGLPPQQVVIIDSSSDDDTRALAEREGFQVFSIERKDFNHGGTRQLAVTFVPWAEVVVFLTQDAILNSPQSVDLLIAPFEDAEVGATYGRQLARPGAGPIEAHARLFNYPDQSVTRTFESRRTLGIKAAFLSNSFSAYRVSAQLAVGGFPSDIIMAEDAVVAARMLMAGYKTTYVAEATVFHSHAYTAGEEFRRYFDTGVYHHREAWLRENFGGASGEGKKFVLSELSYLFRHGAYLIPYACLRTAAKLLGYRLGLQEQRLGNNLSRMLSMHRGFWNKPSY